MNVQGGGIVTAPDVVAYDVPLSLEWLDSVEDDWYSLPKTTLDDAEPGLVDSVGTASVNDDSLVCAGRDASIRTVNAGNNNVDIDFDCNNLALLRRQLLCVPFPLLPETWVWLLPTLSCDAVQVIAETAVALRHDKEWEKRVAEETELFETGARENPITIDIASRGRVFPPGEVVEYKMTVVYVTVMKNCIGEWFEGKKEFRAAVWCYERALEALEKSLLPSAAEEMEKLRTACLLTIAAAYAKMDHVVAAQRYYERALLLKPAEFKAAVSSAKALRKEMKHWIGTSGDVTPWMTGTPHTSTAERLCPVCRTESTKYCSRCRLVWYDCVECQRDHWKLSHKYTCAGREGVLP